MKTMAPKIVGPRDGKAGFLGSIGVRFMIDGHETDDRFSLVEHPMSPRALAAPLHIHTREDEYSFVLDGHEHMQAARAGGLGEGRQSDRVERLLDEPCDLDRLAEPNVVRGI